MNMRHDFPPLPIRPTYRINWAGAIGLGLMAISAGMMLAWIYTIARLAMVI